MNPITNPNLVFSHTHTRDNIFLQILKVLKQLRERDIMSTFLNLHIHQSTLASGTQSPLVKKLTTMFILECHTFLYALYFSVVVT
jgi:hypothetical protein